MAIGATLLYLYCRQLIPKGWLCQADGLVKLMYKLALATFLILSVKCLIQLIFKKVSAELLCYIVAQFDYAHCDPRTERKSDYQTKK
jgi:hypothetical protein